MVGGPALLAAAGLGWGIGQLPRLRGRRGLHLPDPVGRWSIALGLSVIASWVLYLAYILLVARLATSYSSNWLISYGGWLAAQLMALVAVVILVKLVGRIWLVRGHHRRGRHGGGRWLTAPSALVLLCVLAGGDRAAGGPGVLGPVPHAAVNAGRVGRAADPGGRSGPPTDPYACGPGRARGTMSRIPLMRPTGEAEHADIAPAAPQIGRAHV